MPSLSRRDCINLREVIADCAKWKNIHPAIASKLLAALDAALKPKRGVSGARKVARAKRATKAEETRRIREAVFARAMGLCEVCDAPATDLEHVFGRVRVRQSERNCLALCRPCHADRTRNFPSAAHWWRTYREVFHRLGFTSEALRAERNADTADLKRGAA